MRHHTHTHTDHIHIPNIMHHRPDTTHHRHRYQRPQHSRSERAKVRPIHDAAAAAAAAVATPTTLVHNAGPGDPWPGSLTITRSANSHRRLHSKQSSSSLPQFHCII